MSLTLVRPRLVRAFDILDAPQRSAAWVAARVGRLTGSRAAAMLSTVKGGESIGRRSLREQLVAERRTGRPHESTFESPAMRTGLEREAAARAWYEALTGRFVTVTGFLAGRHQQVGVSLDGHVGDFDGLLEIKCPLALTHVDYHVAGTLPPAHRKQVVHALWLTGAPWCDWMSFNPEFPAHLRAFVVRVERDEREIASYALAVALFLREVESAVGSHRGY